MRKLLVIALLSTTAVQTAWAQQVVAAASTPFDDVRNALLSMVALVITAATPIVLIWLRSHWSIMQDVQMNAAVTANATRLAAMASEALTKAGKSVDATDRHDPIVASYANTLLSNYPGFTKALGYTPDKAAELILGEMSKQRGDPTTAVVNVTDAGPVEVSGAAVTNVAAPVARLTDSKPTVKLVEVPINSGMIEVVSDVTLIIDSIALAVPLLVGVVDSSTMEKVSARVENLKFWATQLAFAMSIRTAQQLVQQVHANVTAIILALGPLDTVPSQMKTVLAGADALLPVILATIDLVGPTDTPAMAESKSRLIQRQMTPDEARQVLRSQ